MPKKKYYPGYQNGGFSQFLGPRHSDLGINEVLKKDFEERLATGKGSRIPGVNLPLKLHWDRPQNPVQSWLERMRDTVGKSGVAQNLEDLMRRIRRNRDAREVGMSGREFERYLEGRERGFAGGSDYESGIQGPSREAFQDQAIQRLMDAIQEEGFSGGFSSGGPIGLQDGGRLGRLLRGLSGSEAYSGHGMAKGRGGIEEAREQMAEMIRLREEDPISGPGFDGYLTVSNLREPYGQDLYPNPVTGWGPLDGQRLLRDSRYPGSPFRRSAGRRALEDARRQMYDIRRLREKDLTPGYMWDAEKGRGVKIPGYQEQGLTGRASGGLIGLQEGGWLAALRDKLRMPSKRRLEDEDYEAAKSVFIDKFRMPSKRGLGPPTDTPFESGSRAYFGARGGREIGPTPVELEDSARSRGRLGPDYVGRTGIRRPESPLPEAVADLLMQDPVDRPPVAGGLTADEEEVVAAAEASEGVPSTSSDPFAGLSPELVDAILHVEKRDLTPELSPVGWDQEARDLSASKRSSDVGRRLRALQQELRSGPRKFELGQEGFWDPRTAELERAGRRPDPFEDLIGEDQLNRIPDSSWQTTSTAPGTYRSERRSTSRTSRALSPEEIESRDAYVRSVRDRARARLDEVPSPDFDLPGFSIEQSDVGSPSDPGGRTQTSRASQAFSVGGPGGIDRMEPMYPGGPTWYDQNLMRDRYEQRRHMDLMLEHRRKKAGIVNALEQAGVLTRARGPEGNADGGIVGLQSGGTTPTTPNPTQTQVTSSYVNPAIGQQTADLTDRIVEEGQRQYQPYTGQRIAGFTQPEAIAQQAAINYGMGMGPQGTQQAGTTLAGAGQMIQGAQQGLAGLQPQYQQLAGQFGTAAQGALGQAQAGAQGMQNLAGRAELQGQLAGAGMRQTGAAAQTEQQALGAGQAAAGQAGQALMTGFGQQMGQAGQQALGGQQDYAAGMTGMGTAAQQAGQAGQAQFGQIGGQVGQLGTDIRSQLGGTGLQAQQAGQIGAADIRAAGLEGQQAALAGQGAITGVGSRAGAAGAQTAADIQAAGAGAQQLGQQALSGITGVGGQAQQQAAQAAQRMRDIGGQAPELGKGADMSDYMSQYTGAVTDPQLQQLMEFQKAQGQELGAQAAGAGAFGGYRQGIMQQQQAQEGAQQAADIIGKGQQEAFQSAVGREREDARRREQAQQMGLSAEQQAAAAQSGAQGQALQAQQAGFGAAATGQQQAQQAAQAAGAARQAGLGAEQQAQIAGMGVAQAGQAGRQAAAQQAVQAQQQGISALQQAQQAGGSAAQQAMGQQLQAAQQGQAAGQAGRAAQMQAQRQAAGMADVGTGRQMQGIQGQGALTGQGIGMGMQGLAAQQGAAAQGAQFGLQGQQQGYQAAQGGTQLGLAGLQQAGQLGQQGYGTMGQLMGQQQGAIGAQGGAFAQMGGMGAQLAGVGGQQMGLGAQQQRQQYERIGQMGQAGADQRALQQQSMNMGYQDWQNQQNQERQNIDWQQGAMNRLPYQSTVAQSRYGGGQQPQGGWQQIAGAGLTGAALANQTGS